MYSSLLARVGAVLADPEPMLSCFVHYMLRSGGPHINDIQVSTDSRGCRNVLMHDFDELLLQAASVCCCNKKTLFFRLC